MLCMIQLTETNLLCLYCIHLQIMSVSGWTNSETFTFIELYQKEACIWNPKHEDHKDKIKVKAAWVRIADAMGVPVIEAKKKKEALMASFRLNHKKVLASCKPGAGENEIFKPAWIYYDTLAAFMSDVVYENNERKDEETSPCLKKLPRKSDNFSLKIKQLKRPEESHGVDRTKKAEYGDDEFNVFAKHVAMQLRKLPLPVAIDLQGQIQNMVHQARMTALQEQEFVGASVHFVNCSNSDCLE